MPAGNSSYKSNRAQLVLEIQKAELEGLKATGKRIVTNAKRRVRKRSHDLEKSIRVMGQPRRLSNGVTSLEIGSDLPYAAAQEFGRPDLENYGFTAYLAPAFDEEAPELAADINVVLN
jgi:hypothetical protein